MQGILAFTLVLNIIKCIFDKIKTKQQGETMKRVIFTAICYLILTLSDYSQCKAGEVFSLLSSAKHIFGPKVTQTDLKGKVVFLEYWGIRCPPCKASYPHLVKLQNKYAKSDKFTILASHVQTLSPDVTAFLTQQKVTFPVYQQFREPEAPCGRGIPSAALIDHTGKVVATGHPSTLYSKVAALVKATPNPILGNVKIKYCKAQAKALESGKPVANILKSLNKLSSTTGEKGEEAKQLLEAVQNYLTSTAETLIKQASEEPSKVLPELMKFSKLNLDF